MCEKVIRCSIELSNYSNVASYISKAESMTDILEKQAIQSTVLIAQGLTHLKARHFKRAAKVFTHIPFYTFQTPEVR